MKNIKRHIPDITGILLILVFFVLFISSGTGQTDTAGPIPNAEEYKGSQSGIYELNESASSDAITALFPGKKRERVIETAPVRINKPEKPVRDSSYLSFVSSSVLDTGKTVYMFVDNTIMRIYTLSIGESNGGIMLKEAAEDYFLIDTPDAVERVRRPK